jgi:hypothetical protein
MPDRCCATCRWHDVVGFYAFYKTNARGMGEMGFCRKAPPLPDLTRLLHPGVQEASRDDVFVFALWPETNEDDWCGAWEPCPQDTEATARKESADA